MEKEVKKVTYLDHKIGKKYADCQSSPIQCIFEYVGPFIVGKSTLMKNFKLLSGPLNSFGLDYIVNENGFTVFPYTGGPSIEIQEPEANSNGEN